MAVLMATPDTSSICASLQIKNQRLWKIYLWKVLTIVTVLLVVHTLQCVALIVVVIVGCTTHGWASRVRWDKGSENTLAILRQIDHWYVDGDEATLRRGSALSGSSTKNCRMEYLWRFVRIHVTGKFRDVLQQMRDTGLLSVESPVCYFLYTGQDQCSCSEPCCGRWTCTIFMPFSFLWCKRSLIVSL